MTSFSASGRRRVVIAIASLIFVGAVWTKVRVEAGITLAHAQTLEERDMELAITVYRQTIRWYSPLSGPVEASVQRLGELAKDLEARGDTDLALMAWRALRSGLYSVKWLVQPYEAAIPPAEAAIARLMAAQQAPAGDQAQRDALQAHHAQLLARDPGPHTGWSLLAVLAFLGWVWGLFRLALTGFDEVTGKVIAPLAIRWASVSALCFALWMAGLAKA